MNPKKKPELLYDLSFFKKRRQKLASLMKPHEALVLFSSPKYLRNGDVFHSYRQDSNFYYLTGFEESDSIFVFSPRQNIQSTLFVQKKDPLYETWEGFLYGVEGAKSHFAMDQTFEISEFLERSVDLMFHAETIYFQAFHETSQDRQMEQVIQKIQGKKRRKALGIPHIKDPNFIMGPLRVKKTEEEVEIQRKSCQISAEAHKAVMKACAPGVSERELHGLFLFETMKRGASREGYDAIVASGSHATTLHYKTNHDVCEDGDLLLIDAGAEYHYMSADITRTYPVNKKFNSEQKDLYERVLDVQKKMIAQVRPGIDFKELNTKAIKALVDHLLDLKLLKGSKDQVIENKDFLKYYPHGLGHFLGMDVHDIGAYYLPDLETPVPFEPGYILTIEPGLYIPVEDDQAPDSLRGLGIRIEDDILVTDQGFEVLTHDCPKEISELENL